MTVLFVFMGIALAVVVVVPIYSRRHKADKGAKVKTAGQALGLSDRVNRSALSEILREIPLFSLGRSHTILYALEGERNGVPITVFELQSNAGSSDLRSEHGVYLLMRSPQLQSPAFELEPSDMHFGPAMKFDRHPKFHRRFWLKGHRDNEDAVRNFFTPAFLTFLLEEQPKRFRLWGNGHYLVYDGSGVNNFNHIIRSDKLQAFLDEGLALLSPLAPDAVSEESSPPRPVAATTQDLSQAAASRRNQKISQWEPPKIINFGQKKQSKRIAQLIVDLVVKGGTYKPSVHGMGARTYESRQGKIIYKHPSADPREARMRGQAAGSSEREMSRAGLEGIVQASAANFFPVLNPADSDRIDQAMAEQLLTEIERRGGCNLTDDAYKLNIEPINGRFIYQCDVPKGRYQHEQIRRSFNREDARQWLMEHPHSVFADFLANPPTPSEMAPDEPTDTAAPAAAATPSQPEPVVSEASPAASVVAEQLADLVMHGGTYRPASGGSHPTYRWHSGSFCRESFDVNYRDALMRGDRPEKNRQQCSRDELINELRPHTDAFLRVLAAEDDDANAVDTATAETVVQMIGDRGTQNLHGTRYQLKLALKQNQFEYLCKLPTSSGNTLEITYASDQAGMVQWLTQHRRDVFLECLTESTDEG